MYCSRAILDFMKLYPEFNKFVVDSITRFANGDYGTISPHQQSINEDHKSLLGCYENIIICDDVVYFREEF